MNKRAAMIASQIVLNRNGIREAMDQFSWNDESDDPVQIEDYEAVKKELFGLVYRLVEPLLDAPLPDDKGMESIMRYYGFSHEEAVSTAPKP